MFVKTLAICCFLLPTVCHAACADGSTTCDVMDEAALLQKEMFLDQAPIGVDRDLVSEHLSQSISVAVLKDKAVARNKKAKQLNNEFKPEYDRLMKAGDTFKGSARSAEDFASWKTVVEDVFVKQAVRGTDELNQAIADEAATKNVVVQSAGDMDHDREFGDKLVKFATAWGVHKLVSDVAPTAMTAVNAVKDELNSYEENLKKDFVGMNKDKEYGKLLSVILSKAIAIKGHYETWDQIGDVKIKEIDDATKIYSDHSRKSLNDAIFQLVAANKAEGREELALQLDKEFKPIGTKILKTVGTYETDHTTTMGSSAMGLLQAGVNQGFTQIETHVKSMIKIHEGEEMIHLMKLHEAMNGMEKEEFFADKLTKYTTSRGKTELSKDLYGIIKSRHEEVEKALDAYRKKTMEGDTHHFDEEAYKELYAQINNNTIGLFMDFGGAVTVSQKKVEGFKPGNNNLLSAFTKQ